MLRYSRSSVANAPFRYPTKESSMNAPLQGYMETNTVQHSQPTPPAQMTIVFKVLSHPPQSAVTVPHLLSQRTPYTTKEGPK